MTDQDWAKEPWKSDNGHITDAEGGYVGYLTDFLDPEQSRIIACVNACAGVPMEGLERVEQGKSSVIVADEVLNGQRAHFVMPDSTKT